MKFFIFITFMKIAFIKKINKFLRNKKKVLNTCLVMGQGFCWRFVNNFSILLLYNTYVSGIFILFRNMQNFHANQYSCSAWIVSIIQFYNNFSFSKKNIRKNTKKIWIGIPILLPHRFHKVISLRDYVAWFWLPHRESFVDTSNFYNLMSR